MGQYDPAEARTFIRYTGVLGEGVTKIEAQHGASDLEENGIRILGACRFPAKALLVKPTGALQIRDAESD